MTSPTVLPWQESIWQRLATRRRAGRFPHALLISGPAGVGKRQFSEALLAALLCTEPDSHGFACGRCRSCELRSSESHPDVLQVTIPEKKTVIGVDQIRDLRDYIALKKHVAPHKVVFIAPADAMNTASANALLKSLEEPVPGVVMLLISAWPMRMPATVRSRCQRVDVRVPPRELGLSWLSAQLAQGQDPGLLLALAGGAPCAALELAEGDRMEARASLFADWQAVAAGRADPLEVAAGWVKDHDGATTLTWIEGWLADMARLKATQRLADARNCDVADALHRQVDRLDLGQLDACYRQVAEARRLGQTNVNPQMVLENLLTDWARLFRATH